MKEYTKILDVKRYVERVKRTIRIIDEIEQEDLKKHKFILVKCKNNEEFYTLRKYYNGELKSVIYDTIDVISGNLDGIKQTILDYKMK